ncbi:MAG: CocE/NonD family hydrolase [Pirellulaceae bacterium]
MTRKWIARSCATRQFRRFLMSVIFCAGCAALACSHVHAQQTDQPSQKKLAQWLKQYPDADADKDGELTWKEAQAYRQKRLELQASRTSRPSHKFEFTFAEMSDGVKIALAVSYPRDFDPRDTERKWPAILHMSGYTGAVQPGSPDRYGNQCVVVHASLRGTGASGGKVRALGRQNGMDGHEVIENWIVKQTWSNGRVGVDGHSWPGLTGFFIAATNPPHLKAVAVSGLFDDIYRSIARIGGIRNSGFPVEWMNNLYSPQGVFGSDEMAIRLRKLNDQDYQQIVDSRPERNVAGEVLWQALVQTEDGPDYQNRSPGTFADGVRAPIYIMHAYQDQQTGPSGAWLWSQISDEVPKRLVLTNGDHGMTRCFSDERLRWFKIWLLQDENEDRETVRDPNRRVRAYFETANVESSSRPLNDPLITGDFPLPDTFWIRYYFHAGGKLHSSPPPKAPDERLGGDSYRVEVGVEDDEIAAVHYTLSFRQPVAICGPITVTLWATSTTVDTDFFVTLADLDEEGNAQFLQRGMLRASHRKLDADRSVWTEVEGQKTLIRPFHPHRDPQPLMPGRPYRLDIEVFPLGHVFRPGHQLVVRISQPPLVDPVAFTPSGDRSYTYESALPRGAVTILRDAEHPSSILLPVLPALPPISDQPPGPGSLAGIRARKLSP